VLVTKDSQKKELKADQLKRVVLTLRLENKILEQNIRELRENN